MANCGSFLDIAAAQCGIEVGYGKMFLVYPDATPVPLTDLTVENINAAIASGAIKGRIKGWHTIAGAPVAEVSVERTGTSEMKLIKQEVAADVLTFEANLLNRSVLGSVVGAGSLYCLLLDDMGNVFGEKSKISDNIVPMTVNFSSKVSSAFQSDKVTDKTIAITARYLVKELDVIDADVDTELIETKALVGSYLQAVTTSTTTAAVFVLQVKDKATNKAFAGDIATGEVAVTGGTTITTKTAVYVPATGLMTITLAGTGFIAGTQAFKVSISGAEAYMPETIVGLGEL